MAGLVPAIHALLIHREEGVDARNKCGHDVERGSLQTPLARFVKKDKTP
jgi:hypothetical protein